MQQSLARRSLRLLELADPPDDASESEWQRVHLLRAIELELCRKDKVYWFNTWVWTYNPKVVGIVTVDGWKQTGWLPMDLFPRQIDLVRWIEERSRRNEDGHCGKSRDIGFTWVCGGYALHQWLFVEGYKANFGSRKAEYVDRIGDPDSIFEKIRMMLRRLPRWMRPGDNSIRDNSSLLLNETMDSTIRGESGDDMGRGGRSKDYFFDEFAFVERADSVDAASVANADCRIFGSTVNGMNNLFYRMQADERLKENQKFRFHWSDDPRKALGVVHDEDTGEDLSWEKSVRRKMEKWKFASEYDIDYAASVEGICIPGSWVEAAKKLRQLVHYDPPVRGVVGADVGGGGEGKSVAIARFGALVAVPRNWSHGDTIQTATDILDYAESVRFTRKDGHECVVRVANYDNVGVGKGTQDAFKRKVVDGMAVNGVNTGVAPTETRWPDGQKSDEKFANLKAELWNVARERFRKSFQKVRWLEGERDEESYDWPVDECVILPSERGNPAVSTLCSQLSTVKNESTENGKTIMQSKKSMKKENIASPDHADALILTFAPAGVVETWIATLGTAAN